MAMNDKRNSDDSEALIARQNAFLSGIAEVLPGTVAMLPPLQLFVLLRAVCIFIQLFGKEFMANGKVKREFTFYIDGRQITAGERKWTGEATVTVAIPEKTAYTSSSTS
jgi:hypothetical protein